MESAFGVEHGEFSKGFGAAFSDSFRAAKAGQRVPGSGGAARAHNVGMRIGQGVRAAAPLAIGGGIAGGGVAAAGAYAGGRTGRSNQAQTKKMSGIGGGIVGGTAGLFTAGPIGALAGAGAGYGLGRKAGARGAQTRINNNAAKKGY